MKNFQAIFENSQLFKLAKISTKEIVLLNKSPCDVYSFAQDRFKVVIPVGSNLELDTKKEILRNYQSNLFVLIDDHYLLLEEIETLLINTTRSMSIGDPVEKAKIHSNLLSVHLSYLYNDTTNDTKLKIQYQSASGLAKFLLANSKIHPQIFQNYIKQKHHYIFAQPFLASLFLLGILKHSKIYADREIENLFLTSYFKDIGMSAVPIEKYDKEVLSDHDKQIISSHSKQSATILAGRIPLAPSFFKIIENHHTFSIINSDRFAELEDESELLTGFETMIVSVTDVIAAMISERPYRKNLTLYDALDLIKILIADQYPQEFKMLVLYFQQFFK